MHLRSDLELDEIARWTRPFFSGWVRYHGRFYPSKLREELRTIDAFILRWVSRKYKRFRGHTLAAWDWLRSLRRRHPAMFAHWTLGSAAGSWEPDESRGSRPVLRERGAAMLRATHLHQGL